jgi:hypothetical protein
VFFERGEKGGEGCQKRERRKRWREMVALRERMFFVCVFYTRESA